jgi:hypothetical protein
MWFLTMLERRHAPRGYCLGMILASLALVSPAGAEENAASNGVYLNQTYLEGALDERNFDIDNVMATFEHVFNSLPDQVVVYPTENYFYFQFGYRGLIYAGNMRLDIKDRDQGVVHFAYFNRFEDWNSELSTEYRPLDASDGVVVRKIADLVYDIGFGGRTVRFTLNDLSSVQVPANALADGEIFLGPVFDESGIQFYLIFNKTEKYFSFILNEDVPLADRFVPYDEARPAVSLGMRTGFAFYEDPYRDRKILVGVYQGNVQNNNYFDGPFDQLPDNFIAGTELQDAILTLYPSLDGEIDRLGNFDDQQGRVLVNPYINYSYLTELDRFLECGEYSDAEAALYQCLQPEQDR